MTLDQLLAELRTQPRDFDPDAPVPVEPPVDQPEPPSPVPSPVTRRDDGWTLGHLWLGAFIVNIWLDDPLGVLRWVLRTSRDFFLGIYG